MPSTVIQYFKMDWTYVKVLVLFCIAGRAWSANPLSISPNMKEVVRETNDSYIASCQSPRGIHVMWTNPLGVQITQPKGRIHVEDRWQVKGVNLIFELLEKKDRGNYTCSATVDGKEYKQSFKLTIIKSISFVDTPKVQNASEHQDMLIRCEVDGDPEPKVAWQVKGKSPQNLKHKVMADGLYIKNVTLADSGDYMCRAFQASPIASNMAEQIIALRVLHKPQWPKEQSERERAYGFVSGHVNLSCAAVAEPEPNFEWIKANRSIVAKDTHAQLFTEPSLSVLQLHVHDESVFGEYVCRASNTLGSLERIVVLREAARPATPKIAVQAKSTDTITVNLSVPQETAEAPYSASGPATLDISGYRVQVKQKDELNWDNTMVFDFNAESGPLYVVNGLNPDSVYTLRAAARNVAGLGEYGSEQNYRTMSSSIKDAQVDPTNGALPQHTTAIVSFLPVLQLMLIMVSC